MWSLRLYYLMCWITVSRPYVIVALRLCLSPPDPKRTDLDFRSPWDLVSPKPLFSLLWSTASTCVSTCQTASSSGLRSGHRATPHQVQWVAWIAVQVAISSSTFEERCDRVGAPGATVHVRSSIVSYHAQGNDPTPVSNGLVSVALPLFFEVSLGQRLGRD